MATHNGNYVSALPLLLPNQVEFPHPSTALTDPNGLLAAGGDLTPEWLLSAYAGGIFPWFNDDASGILWWSPDPRAILSLDSLKVSRSLAKRLRNCGFTVTMDQAFTDVIDGCASRRANSSATWITPQMRSSYRALHELGHAHSVEVWHANRLVGGLYGISLGRMFFGESMFYQNRDASKIALCVLVTQLRRWKFDLIDCQIMNAHLQSLGATEIPRTEFLQRLAENRSYTNRAGPWNVDPDLFATLSGTHPS